MPLYSASTVGLTAKVSPDAMPEAAGGEGITGPLNRKA